jgi:hypothetical protein
MGTKTKALAEQIGQFSQIQKQLSEAKLLVTTNSD